MSGAADCPLTMCASIMLPTVRPDLVRPNGTVNGEPLNDDSALEQDAMFLPNMPSSPRLMHQEDEDA